MAQLDESFLLEIFNAAFRKTSILETLIEKLTASYLPSEVWRKVFLEIKNEYEVEKSFPSFGVLRQVFRKNEECLLLINKIRKEDSTDREEVLLNELEDFLKRGMFLEIYNDIADNFNKDNFSKAYEKFIAGADRFNKFSVRQREYERVFKDFSKRNAGRLISNSKNSYLKLTYGIDELDLKTGRPETGEYVLFLAAAKAGKSFCLSHIGMSIARMNYPVAHFQLEGTKAQSLNRYDANFTGSLIEDVKRGEIDKKKFRSIKKIVQNIGRGEIYLIAPERFAAMTMIEIRKKVIDLKNTFGDIKGVIIDYLELSEPGIGYYKPNEEKRRQQKISQQMKDLAVEQNVFVCSATQANNISYELLNDPEFVIRREHLSEDKAKVNPVDGLITINATLDEKKHRMARLFIDAYRERKAEEVIQIATALRRGRFYDRKRTLNEFFVNE